MIKHGEPFTEIMPGLHCTCFASNYDFVFILKWVLQMYSMLVEINKINRFSSSCNGILIMLYGMAASVVAVLRAADGVRFYPSGQCFSHMRVNM
jgi:hypothetical protein